MSYRQKKLGNCLEKHTDMLLMMKNPRGWKLVHGHVTGRGQHEGHYLSHCWLEHNGYVIDESNGAHVRMPKEIYYNMAQIDEASCVKYTEAAARKKVLDTGYYKFWDLPPTDYETEAIKRLKLK